MKKILWLVCLLCVGSMAHGQASPPNAFGRFGRVMEDGLLTLNVSPKGFQVPPQFAGVRVQFGEAQGKPQLQEINPTRKTLTLLGGGFGEPTSLEYTLLYPGFGATYDKSLTLNFQDKQGKPTPAEVLIYDHSLLILPKTGAGVPLQVAFRKEINLRSLVRPSAEPATSFSFTLKEPIGAVRFLTPMGLKEIPEERDPILMGNLRRLLEEWENRPIPHWISTAYQLQPDGYVRVSERFEPVPKMERFAPLPPVLTFAHQNGYSGIRFPQRIERITLDCPTKWGNLVYARETQITYYLKVPSVEERGYVRGSAPAERVQQLNSLVGHLGGDWAKNAVDLGYAGMTNAMMGWAYLTPKNRMAVMQAWKKHLRNAFALPPYAVASKKQKPLQTWKEETEPLTKAKYLWTYYIKGIGPYKYDIEWGIGLPLYGLYKYGLYSGDWNTVRELWGAAQKVYGYIDLGQDWAWMTVVNADHGWSTGTGDPMAAAYCGTLACLQMARALGDKNAEEHYSYLAAKIAVPVVARLWYTAWARERGMIGKNSEVLGFHEFEGFTESALGAQDPWDAMSVLSGDGVLPELYDTLLEFGGDALKGFVNRFTEGFPHWADGSVKYAFPTTYEGNSLYVTMPHIFARLRLGEETEQIGAYLDSALPNKNNGWVGVNVMAEFLARGTPLLLTDWRPAAYIDGEAKPDRVRLTFRLPAKPTLWKPSLRWKITKKPLQVLVNGQPVTFDLKEDRLRFSGTWKGTQIIDIRY